MRLIELEIERVRGIPQLKIVPGGKTFLVCGPNGSGKSAIIDAVDFLITGRISRLTGPGTSGISLAKHGPHIGHDPKQASVRAIIQLPGVEKPIEVSRSMARPGELICGPAVAPLMRTICASAAQGTLCLTRREILRFIAAEAGTRATQMQALLSLSDIEEIRKTLVSVVRDLDTKKKEVERTRNQAMLAAATTVESASFDANVVLAAVNRARRRLGGQDIELLQSDQLKRDIIGPGGRAIQALPMNLDLLEVDVQSLVNVKRPAVQMSIAALDSELRQLLEDIRSDPERMRALELQQLVESGMQLIDETGRCPLCDTSWPPGKLREHLEEKHSLAKAAKETKDRIAHLASLITERANTAADLIKRVEEAARTVAGAEDAAWLRTWLGELQRLVGSLRDPLAAYPVPESDPRKVWRMLAPDRILMPLRQIRLAVMRQFGKPSPEQTAWDLLTRLEENLKALEGAERHFVRAQQSHRRAAALEDCFTSARDATLDDLYDSVSKRFEDLYKRLHEDEPEFTARIEPDGARLDFDVDFYGRGAHPPLALHSEGHQDSMGLCLYLALTEALSASTMDLVLLDDVVMSVDKGHRRELSRVLKDSFGHRQFLITTHDTSWAYELQHNGVVESHNMIEFCGWTVEDGPRTRYSADMWKEIDKALEAEDISDAARRLRRGLEEYFDLVCAGLGAKTIHRMDQRWGLGDLLFPAVGKYRELLKAAKAAAQSWGNTEGFDSLNELDSTVSQVVARTQAENWAVNPSVHYSRWADLGREDFRPVHQAFFDLWGLFRCAKCGATLYVLTDKRKAESALRCSCGNVNWNLVRKRP